MTSVPPRDADVWVDFLASIVGLAEHPQGGEWLRWIAAPLHDLVVSRAQLAAGR